MPAGRGEKGQQQRQRRSTAARVLGRAEGPQAGVGECLPSLGDLGGVLVLRSGTVLGYDRVHEADDVGLVI